jgi:dienelactone hydrolase
MNVKVCSIVFGCAAALAAAAEELPRGQVIEHVACAGRRHCDYALYLPSAYTAARPWPLIVAFDPAARGAVPVRLLQPVAERLGFVVAGSNESRNGPWEPIVAAQKAMWKDLRKRLAIEPKRALATGFSGGARAALRMALDRDDEFLGVIPCGAFFTGVEEFPKRTHLAFYGLVGRDDLALSEFKGAARLLGDREVRLWLEVFEGGHAWPPQERMAEAVEFLRIEAGRKGLAPRDEGLERAWVAARLERARTLDAPGSRIWAAWTYRQLASVFPGVEESRAAADGLQRLAAHPELAEATAREAAFEQALAALDDLNDTKEFQRAWQEVVALAAGGGPLAGRAAHTVRNVPDNLARFALESLDAGEPRRSEKALALADALRPADRLASYNIACGWARLGRKAEALAALERAVAAGFAGRELMLADDDLHSLRDEPAFRALLERLPARN